MDILNVMSTAPAAVQNTANVLENTVRVGIEESVKAYLKEIQGRTSADVYEHILCKVEKPMLEVVLASVRHNQCKAAELLGISRGTLRKKMKKYGLL